MPYKLIEKTSVRIQVKNGESIIKQGSGVIITFSSEYYVLTAFHCLGLEKNSDILPDIKDVIVERQRNYTSSFIPIKVISIHKMNRNDDFILIKIELVDEDIKKCGLGHNPTEERKVRFCGYQHIHASQYRPFDGKITVVSPSKFQIKLLDDTFQQNGEDGSHVAEGLSGSGVYVIINNKPYLIGILCSVKDTQAWNDDIDCCALSKCLSNISCQMEDLSELNHIKAWSENLEREKAQEDIDNYKSLNIEFFENLLRKNMVIHDTQEKAINVTNKELKKYLSLKENVSLLESQYPYIYKKFQNVVKKFQDDVEDQYSRSVRDNNEAKDKRLELKDKLKEELENILETSDMKNDGIKFDLADYQVIEWLLDCSLNFTRKNHD
ncbi:trypsin-like serine protease [Bacteroides sp.]|uniref:trypsin-like serine protease n=1 Tax=Bacteroides sp. TaxID=29523 RepID=UPI0025BF7C6B|nr:trypsin-like serine protease [Bacteroides sp.]